MSTSHALDAIQKWSCPRCGSDCRETSLRIRDKDLSLTFLACVGMTCDLVFATANGMWMGHQFDGEYVPASEHELIHGPA